MTWRGAYGVGLGLGKGQQRYARERPVSVLRGALNSNLKSYHIINWLYYSINHLIVTADHIICIVKVFKWFIVFSKPRVF